MSAKKKLPEIEPYSEEWEKLAGQEARSFAPSIYPCGACNYPVVKGYCCTHCGDSNPETPMEDRFLDKL